MEWATATDMKKVKRARSSDRRKKWEKLYEDHPHIITPQHAAALQRRLKIDNLNNKLCSQEWIDFQCQGWRYVKVLKAGREYFTEQIENEKDPSLEYYTLPLENPWGDSVLFRRKSSIEKE